jgi:hypothetical protein
MPGLMKELHQMDFDYADGDGIDFKPYPEFLSPEETREWIRAWTGNQSLDGSEYLVFGQDGTGGLAAFWCVRLEAGLLDQPIVFLGSEGERGVIASNFWDYLWLLAGGFGPCEAVAYPGDERPVQFEFSAFASKYAPVSRRSPAEILARAQAAFPDFEERIEALIR